MDHLVATVDSPPCAANRQAAVGWGKGALRAVPTLSVGSNSPNKPITSPTLPPQSGAKIPFATKRWKLLCCQSQTFGHVAVLHGIEVDVVDMARQVSVVADGMPPVATLPNSFLASG
jgi:hypothetical protein